MRKVLITAMAALVALAALGAGPVLANHTAGHDVDNLFAVGLTEDQRLVGFDTDNPSRRLGSARITGLVAPDTALVGIDYRVQDGLLYGIGNGGGIYALNPSAGAATAATKVSDLTVPLDGTSFGLDFNPAANALRVISDTGQNLRHANFPAGPTTADGMLTSNGVVTTGVVGAAYTNNDLDPATATTLYDVATATDQVVIQSPANAGTLAATGALGVDATNAGFDIYSTVRDGTTVEVTGLAALQVGGSYRLYEVTLFTGRATDLGAFRQADRVMDLAIPLNQL